MILSELYRRLRLLFRRKQAARDSADEMQLHLDLLAQQQQDAGASAERAHTQARVRFGNPTALREQTHDAAGWRWLESLVEDVRYGFRGMLRSPGVTVVALASLALGIGANTAIFSLIDAVMLRSLPVSHPQQLVMLGDGMNQGITNDLDSTDLFSYPFFRQLRAQNHVFSDVAAMFSLQNEVHGFVSGHAQPEPMHVQLVSGNYFSLLGVAAQRGRVFSWADDQTAGGNPVAVVSDAWWRSHLASAPDVLDRTLKIGDTTYSVVGVAAPEFFGTKVGASPEIWIPVSMIGR